ncbi:MAG: pseudouridine synthase [Limisphaerales bacterium]|jgi:pseudouridine synthase
MTLRLQKYLADAGVASRRASEQIILDGRVEVNGKPIRLLGTKVDPLHDNITVDGLPIRARNKIYAAVNKPVGFLSARKDDRGKTVIELLPREWSHLYPVGRLDKDTEGLIFVTNDGDFSLKLTHPRYAIRKTYLAYVVGKVSQRTIDKICSGIEDLGQFLKAESAKIHEANNSHTTVELVLTEGKNREVRRLFGAHGHQVECLTRIQIGKIRLAELPVGKWRTLTPGEIKSLLAHT